MADIGHGTRLICTVCTINDTPLCNDCIWLPGMIRPSQFRRDKNKPLPDGELSEIINIAENTISGVQ